MRRLWCRNSRPRAAPSTRTPSGTLPEHLRSTSRHAAKGAGRYYPQPLIPAAPALLQQCLPTGRVPQTPPCQRPTVACPGRLRPRRPAGSARSVDRTRHALVDLNNHHSPHSRTGTAGGMDGVRPPQGSPARTAAPGQPLAPHGERRRPAGELLHGPRRAELPAAAELPASPTHLGAQLADPDAQASGAATSPTDSRRSPAPRPGRAPGDRQPDARPPIRTPALLHSAR